MQRYYKDHPEVGGYLYLALRAPNDTWNGFYDNYVYPLIDNLILQFRLFGDIDPDKVFIMGYSHGGYGAYAIGPKMPDRFAAIHASAAAATDGETTGKTLRTTPFTVMVGELDTMYGRYERNLKFKEQIEQLRGGRTDIYPVTITIVKGNGHTRAAGPRQDQGHVSGGAEPCAPGIVLADDRWGGQGLLLVARGAAGQAAGDSCELPE